jgi:ribosome-binding protein aMBF1 (putative translation factor)
MIRTESEYNAARKQIEQDRRTAALQREALADKNLTAEEIERVMEPLISFHLQRIEKAEWYERVRAGDLSPIHDLSAIGQVLIGLRIARNLTQKQLAGRLGVSEAVVSRDEKNEYHGISVERAQRILEARGASPLLSVSYQTETAAPKRRIKRERIVV